MLVDWQDLGGRGKGATLEPMTTRSIDDAVRMIAVIVP